MAQLPCDYFEDDARMLQQVPLDSHQDVRRHDELATQRESILSRLGDEKARWVMQGTSKAHNTNESRICVPRLLSAAEEPWTGAVIRAVASSWESRNIRRGWSNNTRCRIVDVCMTMTSAGVVSPSHTSQGLKAVPTTSGRVAVGILGHRSLIQNGHSTTQDIAHSSALYLFSLIELIWNCIVFL